MHKRKLQVREHVRTECVARKIVHLLPFVLFFVGICSGNNYYTVSESYHVTCYTGPLTLEESLGGISVQGRMYVRHQLTFYCFDGKVDAVNITVPYHIGNLPNLSNNLEVQTNSAHLIDSRIIPLRNSTVVEVRLQEAIFMGDDFSLIMSYCLGGTVEPADQTYWDRLLGRGGNLRATFTPSNWDTNGDLDVEFWLPPSYIVKGWNPKPAVKEYDQRANLYSVIWHLERPEQGDLEFSVLYGKGGFGKSSTTLIIVGVGAAIFLVCICFMIRSRYGHDIEILRRQT